MQEPAEKTIDAEKAKERMERFRDHVHSLNLKPGSYQYVLAMMQAMKDVAKHLGVRLKK